MTKEELNKRVYVFSVKVIQFLDKLPEKKLYWTIGDQLLRSATSIGANIIEAQAASSRKDFINFYNYSLKSANETKYWLCLLKDVGDVESNAIEPLLQEVVELSKIIGASILTLKGKRNI